LFVERSIGLSGSTLSLCDLVASLDRRAYVPVVVFSRPEQQACFAQRVGGANRDRIPRPEVDQRPLQVAVDDQQLVPPAGGVGPGGGAMEHDGAVLDVRRLHPE